MKAICRMWGVSRPAGIAECEYLEIPDGHYYAYR